MPAAKALCEMCGKRPAKDGGICGRCANQEYCGACGDTVKDCRCKPGPARTLAQATSIWWNKTYAIPEWADESATVAGIEALFICQHCGGKFWDKETHELKCPVLLWTEVSGP